MRRAYLLITLAAIALIIGACSQQQAGPSYDDALAVAEDANKAIEGLNWKVYAERVHPDELERFRQMVLPDLERLETEEKPDSVTLFDRTFSLETWRTGPADKFFTDILWTIFNISPELKRSFSKMENNCIGAVAENDTTVHVVVHTEMRIGMQYVEEMNVTTLRKFENEWRVLLSTKIEGVAMMLKQSVGMQQKP